MAYFEEAELLALLPAWKCRNVMTTAEEHLAANNHYNGLGALMEVVAARGHAGSHTGSGDVETFYR